MSRKIIYVAKRPDPVWRGFRLRLKAILVWAVLFVIGGLWIAVKAGPGPIERFHTRWKSNFNSNSDGSLDAAEPNRSDRNQSLCRKLVPAIPDIRSGIGAGCAQIINFAASDTFRRKLPGTDLSPVS